MDAADAAGVRRYVMVSYFYAKPDHGVPEDSSFFPYADAKSAADTVLRESDLDWVILGPSALTDDPGTGLIDTTASSSTSVSRDDVAAVAAYVLGAPGLSRVIIDFNGGGTPIAEALSAG